MKDKEIEDEVKVLRVKEMDVDDQPRERALKYGISSLSTPDLWAIILRTGLQGMPITELCRRLMRDNHGSLFKLERRTLKEVMLTKGIGTTKGLQILAVMEIVRRYNREKLEQKFIVTSAQSVYDYLKSDLANKAQEEIWALFLDRKNQVITKYKSTSGSAVSTIFDLKTIMKEAILSDAQGVILCHNHPSGGLRPSVEDDKITRKMKEASLFMDMRMLDHVILTAEGFYSYADSGRL